MRWTINRDTATPPQRGDRVAWVSLKRQRTGIVLARLHDYYEIAADDGGTVRILHEKVSRLTKPGKSV